MKTTFHVESNLARLVWALMALTAPFLANCNPEETPATLKAGDKIVFLGDSITAQGGNGEFGFINIIKKELATSRPDLNLEIINAGVSGNKVPDAQKRLQKDVIDKKPALVIILLGINDVWHQTARFKNITGTTKEAFAAGLKDLIARSKSAGARVIICTPTVIGEKTDGSNTVKNDPKIKTPLTTPLDTLLDEYADICRQASQKYDAQLLDLHIAFRDHLKTNNPENLPFGILTYDSVHLNADGNQLVAKLMLEALKPLLPATP